jgi:PadR family transcriptional regulator, regulatory protein PadR
MEHQDLWNGLIRLHILHHAVEGEIFGLGIITELRRHGYDLSPGTLYPMLHRLENRGYLKARGRRSGGRLRRAYRATAAGRAALKEAKAKVRELFAELFEGGGGA